ncbi:porin family protein [Nonlabens xiamenensis]|uniref:porin family protein n=1 Tax=Nonlabens xiamenensis TaxID=2341043 RepID=UPI000F60DA2B|nr:porin family protein [Nonlabens xiamenensis]
MKSILFSLTALFAVSFAAQAQDFSYGVIGGVNFSKIDNLGGSGFEDTRTGFHAGLFAELPFAENWSYEGSLLYSVEGEEFANAAGDEVDVKLSYINVPLQFKYYAFKGFSIHAGPQIGFLLKGESSVNDGNEEEIEDTVNTNFAGTFGFGYDFKEIGLYLKGTLTYGFSDIIDNETDGPNRNQLPGTVHASLGYRF